jgi:hypothetical protein
MSFNEEEKIKVLTTLERIETKGDMRDKKLEQLMETRDWAQRHASYHRTIRWVLGLSGGGTLVTIFFGWWRYFH